MKDLEHLDLGEILAADVDKERIELLKKLTKPDLPEDTPEAVIEFILANQARFVDIQYKRFLSGTKIRQEDVDEVMHGSIDIHAHGGSEPFERRILEDELVIQCMEAGMRAVVIKTWYTPSASRNQLLMDIANKWAEEHEVEPINIFGGTTLNYSVGGLNPESVLKCLRFPGMKYVWLPMIDSYHHRRVVFNDKTGSGLHIVDEHYNVLEPLKEIIKICADHNLVLASGHYPYE